MDTSAGDSVWGRRKLPNFDRLLNHWRRYLAPPSSKVRGGPKTGHRAHFALAAHVVIFAGLSAAPTFLAEPLFSQGTPPPTAVADDSTPCAVTQPNGRTAYWNDALEVILWPEGKVVFEPGGPGQIFPDGALGMKFPWWRLVRGPLRIEGRRLDAPAPPLRSHIPDGYGETGFQASGLIFSTTGCWEVTGKVGDQSLTFITLVEKIGDGPTSGRAQ